MMFVSGRIKEFLPEAVIMRFEALHRIEARQYLAELGYLESETVARALERFRTELTAWKAEMPADFARLTSSLAAEEEAVLGADDVNAAELLVLKAMCGLEGECQLALPQGAWPLLTQRVIAYRLQKLAPIRKQQAASLQDRLLQLGKCCGAASLQGAADLSGDLRALAAALTRQTSGLVYLQASASQQRPAALGGRHGAPFRECYATQATPAHWQAFQQRILDPLDQRESAKIQSFFDEKLKDDCNALMLRIVQLRIWMSGFLEHATHRRWTNEVQKKFLEYLGFIAADADAAAANQPTVQVRVYRDKWVLNFANFVALSAKVADRNGNEQAMLASLHELYEEGSAEEGTGRNKIENRLRDKLAALTDNDKASGNRAGRNYRAGNCFLRILDWLREKSNDFRAALEQFFDTVKFSTQKLLEILKNSFRQLDRALHLVLGRRMRRYPYGNVLITETYTGNFDLVQMVAGTLDQDVIRAHHAYQAQRREQLAQTMVWLGQFIRWGIQVAAGPAGWVRIGVQIAHFASLDGSAPPGRHPNTEK